MLIRLMNESVFVREIQTLTFYTLKRRVLTLAYVPSEYPCLDESEEWYSQGSINRLIQAQGSRT